MSDMKKDLIELCGQMLKDAKSGKMTALAYVQQKKNNDITYGFINMTASEACAASAYIGHQAIVSKERNVRERSGEGD